MPATRHFRKVIKITAEMSPNVRRARYLKEQYPWLSDQELDEHSRVVPGVLGWGEYQKRRKTWDTIRQTIGLDAEFYKGSQLLMFPPDWLNHAHARARWLKANGIVRKAEAIGIDPAEGGDKTSMAAVDRYGLIELSSKQTPDTSEIPKSVLAFALKHGVPAHKWIFDRGGGGKQHADYLRKRGFPCRTVGFGEAITLDPKRGLTLIEKRKEVKEEHYQYKNRRAEMYGTLRQLLDPGLVIPSEDGIYPVFALPEEYNNLRSELAPIPLMYDEEGRMVLLPKHKKDKDGDEDTQTLTSLIGHSPDEADAMVLGIWGMRNRETRATARGS